MAFNAYFLNNTGTLLEMIFFRWCTQLSKQVSLIPKFQTHSLPLYPKLTHPPPTKTFDPSACATLCISLSQKSWFTDSDRFLMLLLVPIKAVFSLVWVLLITQLFCTKSSTSWEDLKGRRVMSLSSLTWRKLLTTSIGIFLVLSSMILVSLISPSSSSCIVSPHPATIFYGKERKCLPLSLPMALDKVTRCPLISSSFVWKALRCYK